MIIPVRCFSCNSVIGNKWTKYNDMLRTGKTSKEALDELGLKRLCCRRMLITHVNLIDMMLAYKKKLN